MLQYGKVKRTGDRQIQLPTGQIVQVKATRHLQIHDVNPREINGVDLLSKYYHRDVRRYVEKYFDEVCDLLNVRREACYEK